MKARTSKALCEPINKRLANGKFQDVRHTMKYIINQVRAKHCQDYQRPNERPSLFLGVQADVRGSYKKNEIGYWTGFTSVTENRSFATELRGSK